MDNITHSLAGAALAQGYPDRPIKLVVPFPPGGSVDTVARALQPQLQQQLGQPVVIENRPGANSVLGAQAVMRSAADGYTLLLNASLQVVNPMIMGTPTYEAEKDFTPITYVGALPQLVLVSAQSPYTSLKDLLDDAQRRPGQVQWATAAYGAAGHLAAELLKMKAKVDMPIVPYKGGGPALNDLIGMHVAAMIEPMASGYPHVKSGRLKALAITSKQRVAALPDVPTLEESGVTGAESGSWLGLLAPTGTPPAILTKVSADLQQVLAMPDVQQQLLAQGAVARGGSPADFANLIAADRKKYARIITDNQLTAD